MSSEKNYLVLARKYRPKSFEDLAGQEPIATTLSNAIAMNRVGHAYLFTGPRGVGKTSTARIFAKALNCQKGPTAKPCGQCAACQEIDAGRALDVLEIDGASNRGIDEIRQLRENVKFQPATSRYKIYIIDEVHQITQDAFNALLKTLEEPPAHVKFIFATTSIQKVPATILSRCQKLDFKRIATSVIVEVLTEICKKEKIKAEPEALWAIARHADGGLRDSQSLLDQMAALGSEKITLESVKSVLGVGQEEGFIQLTQALLDREAKKALAQLHQALQDGGDLIVFCENWMGHIRNVFLAKTSDQLLALVDCHESYRQALLAQSKNMSQDDLFYFFAVLSSAHQMMKRLESRRIALEIACLKLAHRAQMTDIQDLVASLKKMEAQIEKKTFSPSQTPIVSLGKSAPTAFSTPPSQKPEQTSIPKRLRAQKEDREEDAIEVVEDIPTAEIWPKRQAVVSGEIQVNLADIWQSLLAALKMEKISVASYLAEGEPIRMDGQLAKIAFPDTLDFHRETLEASENKTLIEKHLSLLAKMPVRVEFERVSQIQGSLSRAAESLLKTPTSAPQEATAPASAESNSPQNDEMIKNAVNLFGGRVLGA